MNFIQSLNVYNVFSKKSRLGNPHDGGYIVNDLILKNTKRLISIGIGREESFELEWAKQFPTTIIEAYDGTYPCNDLCHKFPERINQNIFYVNNDVGCSDKQIPLNTVIDNKNNILLKIDIEGGEYVIFNNLQTYTNLTGLILEIHDLYILENRKKIVELINQNFKDLILFHIHGNSWGGTFDLDLNNNQDEKIIKEFPNVLELTFISKDLVENYNIDKNKFPIDGLDNTNRNNYPDIDLYWVNNS